VREKFGKKAESVAFDDPGGFESGFVIGEAFFGSEAGHADVNAGKFGFARGVQAFDFAMARGGGVEKDDVNIVMMSGVGIGAQLAEGAALQAGFGLDGGGHCCGASILLARLEGCWEVDCGPLKLTIDD
jgi:hypothetical protein